MTYTQLVVVGIVSVATLDLLIFRTRLLRKRIFWASYAIMLFFQVLTNGILTGFQIVHYNGDSIIGGSIPNQVTPPMFGDGRFFFAPFEDIGFGFTLILLTLIMWVVLGRRNVQRLPMSGPPHERVAHFFDK